MGAGERSSAGALPVGGFGFWACTLVAPGRGDVTAESQFASQALQGSRGPRGGRGAGEHSQWGSDSSDCRAGKLELDVRCTGGGRCGSCGGFWLDWMPWRWGLETGETWMRRWERLDGSQLLTPDWTACRWGMAFCISVPDETCCFHLSVHLPICLCVLQSTRTRPASQAVNSFNQSVSQSVRLRLRLRLRLRPRGSPCGARGTLLLTPSLPRGPSVEFCRWGLAFQARLHAHRNLLPSHGRRLVCRLDSRPRLL